MMPPMVPWTPLCGPPSSWPVVESSRWSSEVVLPLKGTTSELERMMVRMIDGPAIPVADAHVGLALALVERAVLVEEGRRKLWVARPVPVRQSELLIVQHIAADHFEVVQIGPMPGQEPPIRMRAEVVMDVGLRLPTARIARPEGSSSGQPPFCSLLTQAGRDSLGSRSSVCVVGCPRPERNGARAGEATQERTSMHHGIPP